MDQIEQIVSDLMMLIEKEINDTRYYRRYPEQRRIVLAKLETKLSSQLARQYVKGWSEGQRELTQKLLKGIGGHK